MGARVLARIDDSSTPPGSVLADNTPIPPEVLSALNEASELWAALTLCLETTAPLTLAGGATFGTLRGTFPDFLCPLRLQIAGVRVRPSTLAELDSSDENWQSTPGAPRRYFTSGFSFFGVSPQPIADTAASLTFARSPVQLVGDSFPEIPPQFHQDLIDFACYRLKIKEGGQGLARGVILFHSFLDSATKHGDFVRAKSRASRYDSEPIELKLFDRSKLMLKPAKK